MDYKLINKALNEIASTGDSGLKLSTFVEQRTNHQGIPNDYDGYQGEYNSYYKIYKIKDIDLYVSLEYRTNSYGEDDRMFNLNFVQPVKKEILTYEPI